MAQADPGEVFEATYDAGVTGLAGTLEVAVNDNQNVVVYGPTALNIIELVVGGTPTGMYRAMITAPGVEGQYVIDWSNDGSFAPNTGAQEDLLVEESSLTLPSLGPDVADSLVCSVWTTSEEVLDCCSTDSIGSDATLLDSAMVGASEILYLASGKQYAGACEVTVRPCGAESCMCGLQVLSRGHLVGWDAWRGCWGGFVCGCRADSVVLLAGYVREVSEVLIDGEVVDPDTYFVRRNRELVRKNGALWPSCQSTDVDDDDVGAFAVTYTYGKAPPIIGQLAAARLACEIVKSCRGDEECALPHGVVRQTRQGITVEYGNFVRDRDGVWRTGIGEVDYFLNAVNPHGLQRPPTIMSPARRLRFAPRSPA